MKNNTSNHEKNGPESLKLLRVPSTPPTTPTTPTTPSSRGLEDVFKDLPITDETSCGIWCIRSPTLQRFANKKAYVFLYGVLGCIFSASYAYFNGTITTIEKRFKIPSKTTGEFRSRRRNVRLLNIPQLPFVVHICYYRLLIERL